MNQRVHAQSGRACVAKISSKDLPPDQRLPGLSVSSSQGIKRQLVASFGGGGVEHKRSGFLSGHSMFIKGRSVTMTFIYRL